MALHNYIYYKHADDVANLIARPHDPRPGATGSQPSSGESTNQQQQNTSSTPSCALPNHETTPNHTHTINYDHNQNQHPVDKSPFSPPMDTNHMNPNQCIYNETDDTSTITATAETPAHSPYNHPIDTTDRQNNFMMMMTSSSSSSSTITDDQHPPSTQTFHQQQASGTFPLPIQSTPLPSPSSSHTTVRPKHPTRRPPQMKSRAKLSPTLPAVTNIPQPLSEAASTTFVKSSSMHHSTSIVTTNTVNTNVPSIGSSDTHNDAFNSNKNTNSNTEKSSNNDTKSGMAAPKRKLKSRFSKKAKARMFQRQQQGGK